MDHRNSEDVAWIKELGYLDTGASNIVFWDAPKTTLYSGWNHVLVRAGTSANGGLVATRTRPVQLEEHRAPGTDVPRRPILAGLDSLGRRLDCIGGPTALIAALLEEPLLARRARTVTADQEATPPDLRQR